ncbi:CBS domain-containing protein [Histidinibacterium lentulum]|uniref:CBS domain-containing protein n=1 Tax=Histidinibacterium lentulum TaxID=2480588 RepID=A0A3N2R9W0_9RHOB|nr:CBS domain-containing protein [Histidinibacterium lentulum]ROU04136.1 CBS domain-containing protein [Histidinibacterium lentulum]
MTVAKILKSKGNDQVVCIAPEKTVADAALMLSERRIGSLVVSSDGKTPLGILSERDIVREIGRRGAGCLQERVEAMMTTRLVTCTREDRADGILATMTQGRFRHMPVMDGEAMVGLITLGDVVKYRLEELEMEKGALEGMIMGF